MVLRRGTARSDRGIRAEARASIIVAGALSLVAITLFIAAIHDLVSHSVPEHTVQAMIPAGVSTVVLAPLGWAKYKTGTLLHSHALMGDGTLSSLGGLRWGFSPSSDY